MNEKLQQIITEYLQSGKDILDQAWVAGQEQVPLLIQEILMFKGIYHSISALTVMAISIAWLILQIKWVNSYVKETKDYSAHATYIAFFIPITMVIFSLGHIIDAIKVFVAPRLYLIEYTAELMKGVS